MQKWVLKSTHADNHYLDCEVYAAAAADILNVRSLYLRDAEGKTPEPRKPVQQAAKPTQEENWINQNDNWL